MLGGADVAEAGVIVAMVTAHVERFVPGLM